MSTAEVAVASTLPGSAVAAETPSAQPPVAGTAAAGDEPVGTKAEMVVKTEAYVRKSLESLRKMGISGIAMSADIIRAIINAIMAVLRRLAQVLGISVQTQASGNESAPAELAAAAVPADEAAGAAPVAGTEQLVDAPVVKLTADDPDTLQAFEAEFGRMVDHLAETLRNDHFPEDRLQELLQGRGDTKTDLFLKGVIQAICTEMESSMQACEQAKSEAEALANAEAVTLGVPMEEILRDTEDTFDVSAEFKQARMSFVNAADRVKSAQNWFVAVAKECAGHPEASKMVQALVKNFPPEFAERVQKSMVSATEMVKSVAQSDAAENKLSDNQALNEVRRGADCATEFGSGANPRADLSQLVPTGVSRFGALVRSVGDMDEDAPLERQAA